MYAIPDDVLITGIHCILITIFHQRDCIDYHSLVSFFLCFLYFLARLYVILLSSHSQHLDLRINFSYIQARYACSRNASCYSLLLVLGPSALGKGEISSANENLRNLRCTKNICPVILELIT